MEDRLAQKGAPDGRGFLEHAPIGGIGPGLTCMGPGERTPKSAMVHIQDRQTLESSFTINWLGIDQGIAFDSIYRPGLMFLRTTRGQASTADIAAQRRAIARGMLVVRTMYRCSGLIGSSRRRGPPPIAPGTPGAP